jgi:hypothetical protein
VAVNGLKLAGGCSNTVSGLITTGKVLANETRVPILAALPVSGSTNNDKQIVKTKDKPTIFLSVNFLSIIVSLLILIVALIVTTQGSGA